MLHQFLTENRDEIIARTRLKLAFRSAPRPTEAELEHGVPLFLEQFADTLRPSRRPDGTADQHGDVESAVRHGAELRRPASPSPRSCSTTATFARPSPSSPIEKSAPISPDEFQTAQPLPRQGHRRGGDRVRAAPRPMSRSDDGPERLGFLAHELRNLLNTATLAVEVLKSGTVGLDGATGVLWTAASAGFAT